MLPGLNVTFCMCGGQDTTAIQAAGMSGETFV